MYLVRTQKRLVCINFISEILMPYPLDQDQTNDIDDVERGKDTFMERYGSAVCVCLESGTSLGVGLG